MLIVENIKTYLNIVAHLATKCKRENENISNNM